MVHGSRTPSSSLPTLVKRQIAETELFEESVHKGAVVPRRIKVTRAHRLAVEVPGVLEIMGGALADLGGKREEKLRRFQSFYGGNRGI